MIPETQQPAVTRALQAAFGVDKYEEIRPLSGGLSSAFAFKVVVKENPYLLKILRTEIISDPAQEFACMQRAAEAGIAPRVLYANVEDRILISDFVEAQPFPEDMLPLIVPTLRTLHALPLLPAPRIGNYFDGMDKAFVRRFQAAKLLPDSATEELFRRYDELVSVYPRDGRDLVSCHNDLKPQNMRFDGSRLWLVDWESAFLNDRYVDLAIVANFFVKDEDQEDGYLAAYFGEPAGDSAPLWGYRRARFYLMRQALSMFYAALLLLEAYKAGQVIDAELPTPGFREYHQDLIADKRDMLQAGEKVRYGLIHLREALRNMRTPRFAQALLTVGEFQAGKGEDQGNK